MSRSFQGLIEEKEQCNNDKKKSSELTEGKSIKGGLIMPDLSTKYVCHIIFPTPKLQSWIIMTSSILIMQEPDM